MPSVAIPASVRVLGGGATELRTAPREEAFVEVARSLVPPRKAATRFAFRLDSVIPLELPEVGERVTETRLGRLSKLLLRFALVEMSLRLLDEVAGRTVVDRCRSKLLEGEPVRLGVEETERSERDRSIDDRPFDSGVAYSTEEEGDFDRLELAEDDRAGLLGRVERADEFELDGCVYDRLGIRVVLRETEGVEVLGGAEGLTV